jgi:hypothetical protein
MAIGTLAAVGLGLAAAGTAASSIVQGNAANRATSVAQQTATENNALARDIYNKNFSTLSPTIQRGDAAGSTINALLGLGGMQQQAAAAPQSGPDYAGYVAANPDLQAEFGRVAPQFGGDPSAYGLFHYSQYGQNEGRALPTPAAAPTAAAVDPQAAAKSAYDIFRNSTGYDFSLKQGLGAVSGAYGGRGVTKSGAAMKGLADYASGKADENIMSYFSLLNGQQQAGLGAGSALAGVGTNFVSQTSANNNSAGTAAANAALYKAQNTPLNALSLLGGGLYGYGR